MHDNRTNGTATVPPGGVPAGGWGSRELVSARPEAAMLAVPARSDAISMLQWGLRRYAWLVALCALAVTALVPAYAMTREVEYQAEALVVAQQLDMDHDALPRLGEAVFDNGEVARRINTQFGDAGDVEDVIPRRVSLVTEQDSIVFRVIGHDPSPITAADLANLAAGTLTEQLNAPGEGVGRFALQSQAVPPVDAVGSLPPLPVLLLIGFVAGITFGIVAVAVLLVVRRPVLDAEGAVQATGVPVLGSVTMPRTRANTYPELPEISGIVPVCRRLLAMGRVHTVVLVDPAGSAHGCQQLFVAMFSVLGRVRRVQLMVESHVAAAAELYTAAERSPSPTPHPTRPLELTLMDGRQPLDAVQLTSGTLTVLVVASGTSTATVREAVSEHLGDSGRILMLHQRRSRRWSRTAGRSTPRNVSGAIDASHMWVGDRARRPVTRLPEDRGILKPGGRVPFSGLTIGGWLSAQRSRRVLLLAWVRRS